jgi:GTPase
VDATGEHAGKDYKTVRCELQLYGHGLADKREIVALSKVDAVTPEILKDQKVRLRRASGKTPLVLSAHSHVGVTEALRALFAPEESTSDSEQRVSENVPAWQP